MELSWYEIVYACKCDIQDFNGVIGENHAYCISCIHSIVKQYNELKPFMEGILADTLDSYCIGDCCILCW